MLKSTENKKKNGGMIAMKELKKRFLIGMLSGVLIFTGGLGAYHLLNTETLNGIEQISALKEIIRQAGEIAKTSNKNTDSALALIKI